MKIRTKLVLSAGFLIEIVCCVGLLVLLITQNVNTATQKELLANQFVRDVFDLNLLTDDYLLHQEERAIVQWHKKSQIIEMALTRTELNDPHTKEHLKRISQSLSDSQKTFDQLVGSPTKEQPSDLDKRLIGKLQINAQVMFGSATQLSYEVLKERELVKEWADMLIPTLVFVLAFVIFLIFLLLYRSIIRPINNLVAVAQKVQRGDLSKRAAIFSKDEMGDLASADNLMLDALKESHENLEQKVQERTKELQAANKDLEAFSYSVSHDLRAPLRAIDGFSQILEEDYATKFDKEGKDVITTIRTSTKKMGDLIDDLLTFSRIGRQAIKTEKIDMTILAKTIFDELKKANSNRSITFTCENLPPTQGDPMLMRQVWVNLLSNAIKYTKNQKTAIITLGSTEKKDTIVYWVKDNGAGFDMQYVNKLFGVFQRLHDARDFEGTGVGLAIVARIIAKHGGKVWAEGLVNKGATFSFSLPKST